MLDGLGILTAQLYSKPLMLTDRLIVAGLY